MNAQSAISRAIAEKRRLMFERHGGIMSSTDVAREVGYCPRASSGDRWAAEHDIPAIRMGPRKRGYFEVSTDYLLGRTDYPCVVKPLSSHRRI